MLNEGDLHLLKILSLRLNRECRKCDTSARQQFSHI